MTIKSWINLLYILILLVGIVVTIVTSDLHVLTLALIVLIIVYTSFTILLTFLDQSLKVPDSRVLASTGEMIYNVVVSKHLFGTYPIYIYSGGIKVAEAYRGTSMTLQLSQDDPIAVSRESLYKDVEGYTELSSELINYISEKDTIGNIIIDYYPDADSIDESKYMLEYESMRAKFLSMDLSTIGVAVTAILVLLAAYFTL